MHDDVLRLDVAVDDPLAVDVIQSFADLLENCRPLRITETLLLLEHSKKVPVHAQLLEQVNALGVVEEPVEVDDVVVLQVELDLYFPD